MTPYDMIKAQLSTIVPFQNHVGAELLEVGDGVATATLTQRDEISNHIKTVHAGAMFTLGEAASGAAMAGALAPVILQMRPVAANAKIAFTKIAHGTLLATARSAQNGAALMGQIKEDGKVAFDVTVDITDEAGDTVAEMVVNWHVSATR